MKGDELKIRTKEFVHRCVKLAMVLPNTQLGSHIRGLLIRCSTLVAANYRVACIGQSKASFISKLSIVIEEADESNFWLEFIIDENLLKKTSRRTVNERSRRTNCNIYYIKKNRYKKRMT